MKLQIFVFAAYIWQLTYTDKINDCLMYMSPAINYTMSPYNSKSRHGSFHSEHHLTLPMMMKGFQKFLNNEITNKFDNFFNKISQGKVIHVIAIGGTFSYGSHCCIVNTWIHRLIQWLEKAYPNSKIELHNYATASTTSIYGHHLLEQYKGNVDLILVGYSVNDVFMLMNDNNMTILHATENILRYAVKKQSAILFLSESPISDIYEKSIEKLCLTYHAPIISYRTATIDNITKSESLGRKFRSVLWSVAIDNPHPPWHVHQLCSDMISYFFTLLIDYRCKHYSHIFNSSSLSSSSSNVTVIPNINPLPPLPPYVYPRPPMRGGGDNSSSATYEGLCSPPTTLYSSLSETGVVTPFEPFDSDTDEYRHTKLQKYHGWTYQEDVPGKPFGWIASSSNRALDYVHIAFKVTLLYGQISVSYLSSYHNCGKFELWISNFDFSSNGAMLSAKPNVVGCCNKNMSRIKRLYPPSIGRYIMHSHSVYVDTFQNITKTSEIKSQSFSFGMFGSFLLHVAHERLPREEFVERGGDKVKILSILAC
eukprot:gene10342-21578_t